MREDAADVNRKGAFRAAQMKSHEESLDEYINFLSEHMEFFEFTPSLRSTANFKL
jgi:hypothetical protein